MSRTKVKSPKVAKFTLDQIKLGVSDITGVVFLYVPDPGDPNNALEKIEFEKQLMHAITKKMIRHDGFYEYDFGKNNKFTLELSKR